MDRRFRLNRGVGLTCAAVTLVLAGCGTTVPLAAQLQSGGAASVSGGSDALGATTTTGTTGGAAGALPTGAASVAGPAGGSTVTAPGAAGQPATATDATGAGGSAAVSQAGVSAPGRAALPTTATMSSSTAAAGSKKASARPVATATSASKTTGVVAAAAPITIGIAYAPASASDSFSSSLGSSLASGDDKANFTALVASLNKHGGVMGHQVNALYFAVDVSSDVSTQASAACSEFTQDNHVFAALNTSVLGTDYVSCLNKAGVPVIDGGDSSINEADYGPLATFVQPDAIALDRLAAIEATQFSAMGLFSGGTTVAPVKVGILYYDQPSYTTGEKALAADLKAKGVTVGDEVAISPITSEASVAQTETGVQSAVLRFRSDGITTVLTVENSAFISAFFQIGASSQGYYPRYGLNSDDFLSENQLNVPAKENAGTVFVGWLPAFDVTDASTFPATTQACIAELTSTGITVSTGNQRNQAVSDCDALSVFAAGLSAGGPAISRQSFVAGLRAAGSIPTAGTFGLALPAGNGDGVTSVRQGKFDTTCSCFTYTSPPITVS